MYAWGYHPRDKEKYSLYSFLVYYYNIFSLLLQDLSMFAMPFLEGDDEHNDKDGTRKVMSPKWHIIYDEPSCITFSEMQIKLLIMIKLALYITSTLLMVLGAKKKVTFKNAVWEEYT